MDLIDELTLSVAPCPAGRRDTLFADGAAAELDQIAAVEAPGVTHLRYGVRR